MPSPIESLNNAIVNLEWHTRNATLVPNVDVRNAIALLGAHWARWYNETYRKTFIQIGNPGAQWADICDRYLRWYARAWTLTPEGVRARVPRPEQINVSRAALALDEMQRAEDAYQAVIRSGIAPISQVVRDQSRELIEAMRREAVEVVKVGALSFGAVLALAGLAYVCLKGSR